MLKRIIERRYGPLTALEYSLGFDMATQDIMANQVKFGKKTGLAHLLNTVTSCVDLLRRYKIGT